MPSVVILHRTVSGTTDFPNLSLVTAVMTRAYKTLLLQLRTLHKRQSLAQTQRPESNSASYPDGLYPNTCLCNLAFTRLPTKK